MESGIGFVAVAVAIFVSFAVALGMEWLSLVLLMRLMPARPVPRTVVVSASRGDRESEQRAA